MRNCLRSDSDFIFTKDAHSGQDYFCIDNNSVRTYKNKNMTEKESHHPNVSYGNKY